jgi:probable F420-dependent oxidoreductase
MPTARSRIGISMPILNQPYARFPELAALADDAGFASVWDYEFYRNPFIIHALCAQATSRIQLCTGIAAASGRSPNEMANAAADVDELSGGRVVLGMSTGGAGWAELFNGTDIDRPAARMREYIGALRAAWDHHATGEPAAFAGEFYRLASPPVNPWGTRALARPRIPVYLAAIRPVMLRLAGEVADGTLSFLCTPDFVTERILPEVAAGAARAGRDAADVDVTSLVLCSVSEDRAEARRRARINVGCYAAYPVADEMIRFAGLQEDRDAVVAAFLERGPAAFETATSDALLEAFSICGTPDEARAQLQAWDGVLAHIVLHTPYVPPIAGPDSEDAFRNTVAAFAPLLQDG